jgi:thiamine biosynthesis lipoprotein
MLRTSSRHVHVEQVMGTAVTIDVRGCVPPPHVIDDAVRRLHDVDAAFSTYRQDSAVCRFDRGGLKPAEMSSDLRWVIEQCEVLRRETGGFFDARAANGAFDTSALSRVGRCSVRPTSCTRRA